MLSREEAQNFLRRQIEGKEQVQYCATIKDAVPHHLQRYGNRTAKPIFRQPSCRRAAY